MGRLTRSIGGVALALALAGCGGRGSSTRASDGDGGPGAVAAPLPAIPVALRTLGKGALDEYGWRAGPGKAAFDRALAAERAGDLPTIEREASAALAADPGHLEAAWVAAVARARLGQHAQVLPALEIAAAGDWNKWGERSLELAALADFRATPQGRGWVEAADGYRAAMAAALARSVVVIGRSGPARGRPGAELYAVDLAEARWLRLTRTGGTVAGALPADGAPLLAYVAHRPVARGPIPELRIGVVDLATGKSGREVALREVKGGTLVWRSRGGEPVLELQWTTGASKKVQAAELDWKHGKRTAIDKPRPVKGARLQLDGQGSALRRLPVAGVTADWDERGTASAIRLDRSGKVVTAPEGALIDGDTVALAPDGSRLVFAVAAEPPCHPDDERKLYVAEVATGRVRKLAAGAVAAALWLDDDRIAFVDGDGVKVAAAATGKPTATVGGGAGVSTTAVGAPRRCDPAPAPFADDADDDGPEPPETPELFEDWAEPDAGAGPADAGTD